MSWTDKYRALSIYIIIDKSRLFGEFIDYGDIYMVTPYIEEAKEEFEKLKELCKQEYGNMKWDREYILQQWTGPKCVLQINSCKNNHIVHATNTFYMEL